MVKCGEFFDAQNECIAVLTSMQVMVDYASKLIDFVSVKRDDEDENVAELQPCSEDHLDNLMKVSKQLSSYSDKFNNKLSKFKKIVERVNSIDYKDTRSTFYRTLEELLCELTRPIKNDDGTVSPNKLISIRIDDAYKRTGTDIVEVHVSSFSKPDPQLFIFTTIESNTKMRVSYNNDVACIVDIGDGKTSAKEVVDCILNRM